MSSGCRILFRGLQQPEILFGREKSYLMRDAIEKCTQDLMEAIRNSEEFKDFEKSRAEMAKYPELRQQVNEFRKRIYLLQNSDVSIDLMDEMSRLFQEREELYRNQLAAEYLASELRICRILQGISMEVMNVTDVEIDAFEEVISV